MSDQALELVAGGVYRNPLGAEIRVVRELNRNVKKDDPLFRRGMVPATLGAIWVAEDATDDVFGLGRMLVTAEGLTSCGYERVEAGE